MAATITEMSYITQDLSLVFGSLVFIFKYRLKMVLNFSLQVQFTSF